MPGRDETRYLPGLLVGALGVVALVAGFAASGPDAIDGLVFGGVALAAAAVMLWRRTPTRRGPERPADAGPAGGSDVDLRSE